MIYLFEKELQVENSFHPLKSRSEAVGSERGFSPGNVTALETCLPAGYILEEWAVSNATAGLP